MRMQLLKIVVVLLVAGSGDTRPQNGADSQAKTIERSDVGWRGVQVSSKSHDIVRDDSRYTRTSGSNRKSYITHFRDNDDSSREHNAIGLRASDFARAPARSFSARRSKIDDIWTMPEFKATSARPRLSRTDVPGEIAKIAIVRNSSEMHRSSFHASPGNSETIQNDKAGRTRLSPDLEVGRTNYFGRMNIEENLERSKSGVISNENLGSVIAQMRHSGSDFLAARASGFRRINDGISIVEKNLRKLSSVKSDLLRNKGVVEGNTLRRKTEQDLNGSSLQIARTNVPSDSQTDVASYSIYKNRNPIRKNANKITNPIVISREDSKPSVVTDSFRHIGGNRRNGLNNSRKSTHDVETRLTLIPNSKSKVVGHNRSPAFPPGNAVTSHRNFVKLRYPYSTSNQRNASNVASNTKLKNDENVDSTVVQLRQPAKGHFTQAALERPVKLNNHATSKLTKNNHSLSAQKSPSQGIGGGNKTRDEHHSTPVQYNEYLKNWPNEALQNIEDLYNYEKYTSSLEEESSHESSFPNAETSILSSDGGYFDHSDPILDSSVQKIIHWLKVPAIVPNNTQFSDYNGDVYKPSIDSVLESVYENLEPNRPLVNTYDSNYETVNLQDTSSNQNLDEIDQANYPIQWSNSISRPQYVVGSSNPSAPSWSDVTSLQNKTVFNPLTHVTQNTVVHILNDGLKKPNVTVTQLKVAETDTAVDQAAPSGSSSNSSSDLVQRPNVHVMFTSQKDEDKEPSKQETFPSSNYNSNCPTIMINTYTKVNNTIQSKEGCTDLNIIVNSHVLNTNTFTPSGTPAIAENQQTSLVTQGYGDADDSEKYAEANDDLSYQNSLGSYVTASTGTYSSGPLETLQPGQHDYYDSQKNPGEFPGQGNDPGQSLLSTVEVSQGTQISISGSNVPLTDAEVTASPAGSIVDSPAVGPGDDASSSAVDPPAAVASASGPSVAGSSNSANPSVSAVAPELPVYLVKPGPIKGQSNNALGPGSLQLPSLPNIAIKPGLTDKPSVPGGSPSLSSGSSVSSSDDDDDDDDDDEDVSPGSVLQSIASVFTYFSFLNPLGYGFFSLAAAPFAAMAAGMLGVAVVVFPWAIPGVFELGRSSKISFAPNLEDFIRRAVHKYDRLNEWKSRRRKRRR